MSPEVVIEADVSPDISELAIEDDDLEGVIDADLLPDISELAIEDDVPVDNLISEKQQRLLTEPLYSNPSVLPERSFLLAANVGVFYAVRQPPLVPDVFLSLDVEVPQDWREKKNRTYFVWEFGKPPDVVIEIVSNKEGNELGSKLNNYARMGVAYYLVFDPLQRLGDMLLRSFELRAGRYEAMSTSWLEAIGVGLTLWDGTFEGKADRWLRWCNAEGVVIPTGAENAEQERQRAEQERQRAERAEAKAAQLAEQLRAMGIDPDA
ncbi:MAG: Uma2 family endonuclease [Tildeniella nuda ZEHNDER 1965/U140]|jgi:Uma2 family endonuclease|nr:Uma2 family endonuclease [Tildeniella nuda ZEHNDER 1965/U140]